MDDTVNYSRIVIVDDLPTNLKLLKKVLLVRDNYKVMEFPDPFMALKAITLNPPDLVLLDINMPGMNGFELCEKLKEDKNTRDIPVIFLSALDDSPSKVKAFLSGGVDYVTKPFQSEEVIARVDTHLKLRRLQVIAEQQKEELRESYVKLKETEEMRDSLVHMIVHDLRSTWGGIYSWLELLQQELKKLTDITIDKYINKIFTSGHVLQDMISNVLDVNRIESDHMPLFKEDSDIRDIVDSSLQSLGDIVNRTTLIFDKPEHPIVVQCDSGIIQRVITNLVMNAIKFTGRRGEVKIILEKGGDSTKVSVVDTGVGIPAEHQAEIFDKYYQIKNKKQGKFLSSGLGLAFSKLAIESHGGKIGLESEEGKGSTFWFTIPHSSE